MTTTVLNTKIGKVENKIQDTSGLATTALRNKEIGEAENKIPVSNLLKKTYIRHYKNTNSDYNKFTSDILDAKIKQKELANKSSIYNLVKKSDLNTKLATLAQKHN